jgi:radical SAM/Cys-rich protein
MNEFEKRITRMGGEGLHSLKIETLQVNLGLKCNQQCRHCHLEASPQRQEMMDWPIMEKVLGVAEEIRPQLVDLTGGAPELNPHFRPFIAALRKQGHPVQVRTNLAVLSEPGMEDLPSFFQDYQILLVASLPCYLEENVCAQRGQGVYEKSIKAIRLLNSLGYGKSPEFPLNLVYNPGGPFLPPSQPDLEKDYKRELGNRFSITFTHLLTITNVPLGRFRRQLQRERQEQQYLQLLRESFNPQTVPGLMCRHQLSVGWDGTLYDCDFNLALGLRVNHGAPDHLRFFKAEMLKTRRIVTGEHCFACTAGSGSSCGGALV